MKKTIVAAAILLSLSLGACDRRATEHDYNKLSADLKAGLKRATLVPKFGKICRVFVIHPETATGVVSDFSIHQHNIASSFSLTLHRVMIWDKEQNAMASYTYSPSNAEYTGHDFPKGDVDASYDIALMFDNPAYPENFKSLPQNPVDIDSIHSGNYQDYWFLHSFRASSTPGDTDAARRLCEKPLSGEADACVCVGTSGWIGKFP